MIVIDDPRAIGKSEENMNVARASGVAPESFVERLPSIARREPNAPTEIALEKFTLDVICSPGVVLPAGKLTVME